MKYGKVFTVIGFWLIVRGQYLGFHSFNKYFQLELDIVYEGAQVIDYFY